LKIIIDRPKVLMDLQFYENRKYVSKKYNMKDGLPVIELLDILPEFNEEVSPYAYLEGASSPIDIAILNALARRFPSCHYFEIGTWRGESIANVSKVSERCVSLSFSDDELRRIGYPDSVIGIHRHYSRDLPNVEHIGHDSHSFDFSEHEKQFDLVFVDGDHSYEGVVADTRSAFDLLRNDDSIIVWHDYIYNRKRNWQILSSILDGSPTECRDRLYHISNSNCAIFVNKSFKTSKFSTNSLPRLDFTVKISCKRTSD